MAALALAVIAAMWLVPVLPTSDGHSHVYNAMVGVEVARGDPVYTAAFTVDGGFRPNVASWTLLTSLGPVVGWDAAERVVASVAFLMLFGGVMGLFREFAPAEDALVCGAVAGAWLGQSWFFWMGFYDFCLSMGLLLVIPILASRTEGVRRGVGLSVLLVLLYLTHLFGFAAGACLLLVWTLWRAGMQRRVQWDVFVPAVLGLLVVAFELLAGDLATSGGRLFAEMDPAGAAVELVIGRYLTSFGEASFVASIVVTATALLGAVRIIDRSLSAGAGSNRSLLSAVAPHEAFGLMVLLSAFVLPDYVGAGETVQGEFLRPRVQLTGLLLLLPAAVGGNGLGAKAVRASGLVLAAVLPLHLDGMIRIGHAVEEDLSAVDQVLIEGGARGGDWTQNISRGWDTGTLGVGTHEHFEDRVNLRRRYLAADDYEAFRDVFPVSYRVPPPRFERVSGAGDVTLRLRPGFEGSGRVFLVHRSAVSLVSEDERVEPSWTASQSGISVTRVRITPPGDPRRVGSTRRSSPSRPGLGPAPPRLPPQASGSR